MLGQTVDASTATGTSVPLDQFQRTIDDCEHAGEIVAALDDEAAGGIDGHVFVIGTRTQGFAFFPVVAEYDENGAPVREFGRNGLLIGPTIAVPNGGRLFIETANISFDDSDRDRRPVTNPGDYVLLAVSDTGVGIPHDIQDKIFEPFFTTKQGTGNSGLGLATLYGIVKQNAGNVWVYSEPGFGTTFKIYLPRCHEAATAPARPAATVVRPGLGGSERILVVEDNAEVREATQGLLAAAGYEVFSAADGLEALVLFSRLRGAIDLVITDVVMPGLSGPEVAEQLRKYHPAMRTLFLSGYASHMALPDHVTTEPGAFLQKPFTANALMAKVRDRLSRS